MEQKGRYQERDRLQALFSDCVVLTASYAKNDFGHDSGARWAMEYAANYSIPRAVMYDSARDSNNPKYNLNKQLKGQNNIIVISRENVNSATGKIMCKQPQADLFGYSAPDL